MAEINIIEDIGKGLDLTELKEKEKENNNERNRTEDQQENKQNRK